MELEATRGKHFFRFFYFACLLGITLTGCAPVGRFLESDTVVRTDLSDPRVQISVNEEVRGEQVIIETVGGQTIKGVDFYLDADSARFLAVNDSVRLPRPHIPMALATPQVRSVGFYVSGAMRYGLVGAGVGALLGIGPGVLAGISGENSTPLDERRGYGNAAREGALAGAITGALFGSLLFMFAQGDLGLDVLRRYENLGARGP
ncbi:MAG: hypothetical protein ABJF88_06860 [Rhodothermales bacterium]